LGIKAKDLREVALMPIPPDQGLFPDAEKRIKAKDLREVALMPIPPDQWLFPDAENRSCGGFASMVGKEKVISLKTQKFFPTLPY